MLSVKEILWEYVTGKPNLIQGRVRVQIRQDLLEEEHLS